MDQSQASKYIGDLAKELLLIARSAGFETTCYILSMVVLDMAAQSLSVDDQVANFGAEGGEQQRVS